MTCGITGPPLYIGAPLFSWRFADGRLRITPTVLASGACVTSTTVSWKLGSVRLGFATSRMALGSSARCAPAGSAMKRTSRAAATRTAHYR